LIQRNRNEKTKIFENSNNQRNIVFCS